LAINLGLFKELLIISEAHYLRKKKWSGKV